MNPNSQCLLCCWRNGYVNDTEFQGCSDGLLSDTKKKQKEKKNAIHRSLVINPYNYLG